MAFNSINQGIGRAIRHSNDYGAIITIDSRFNDNNKNLFSNWVKPYIKIYDEYYIDDLYKNIQKFFNDAEKYVNKKIEQEKIDEIMAGKTNIV